MCTQYTSFGAVQAATKTNRGPINTHIMQYIAIYPFLLISPETVFFPGRGSHRLYMTLSHYQITKSHINNYLYMYFDDFVLLMIQL